MRPDREQQYSNIVYTIRQGGGRVVSPDGAFPVLFEASATSSLPEVLAPHGSVASLGMQERLGNVTEVVTRDVDGKLLKEPRTVQHPGISTVAVFRFDPPRISVPQD
jgi:hypothetical protein